MESPFLYERAISAQNYFIIPFQYGQVSGYPIYSYALLSAFGHHGAFHQAINPAHLFSSSFKGILDIAQEHLAYSLIKVVRSDDPSARLNIRCPRPEQSPHVHSSGPPPLTNHDPFQQRYTYQGHLIIIRESRGEYFYDHYPPHELRNIAAPKFFTSESECLSWIKIGIDQRSTE